MPTQKPQGDCPDGERRVGSKSLPRIPDPASCPGSPVCRLKASVSLQFCPRRAGGRAGGRAMCKQRDVRAGLEGGKPFAQGGSPPGGGVQGRAESERSGAPRPRARGSSGGCTEEGLVWGGALAGRWGVSGSPTGRGAWRELPSSPACPETGRPLSAASVSQTTQPGRVTALSFSWQAGRQACSPDPVPPPTPAGLGRGPRRGLQLGAPCWGTGGWETPHHSGSVRGGAGIPGPKNLHPQIYS